MTNQKNKKTRFVNLANTFGIFGYISVTIQWLWIFLLYTYPYITGEKQFSGIFFPNTDASARIQPLTINFNISPVLTMIITFVVILIILTITIIAIIRLPKEIGKTASQITHQTSDVIVPVVTKHKKISKKKRVTLSYKIINIIKALALIIPLLLIFWTPKITYISTDILWFTSILLAALSLLWFSVQYTIASVVKIPKDLVW